MQTWKKLQCEFSECGGLWWTLTSCLSRPVLAAPDPDLREYQREMALSTISTSNLRRPATGAIDRKSKRTPFFDLDDGDELLEEQPHFDDHLVAYAVQESFDETNLTKNDINLSR